MKIIKYCVASQDKKYFCADKSITQNTGAIWTLNFENARLFKSKTVAEGKAHSLALVNNSPKITSVKAFPVTLVV